MTADAVTAKAWVAARLAAPDEALEIHDAQIAVPETAGGIGSGVGQRAKAVGATVSATAGTDEKVKFCYDLGADYAVNYAKESFLDYANEVTNGRGVNIAFDTIGGQVTQDTFKAM